MVNDWHWSSVALEFVLLQPSLEFLFLTHSFAVCSTSKQTELPSTFNSCSSSASLLMEGRMSVINEAGAKSPPARRQAKVGSFALITTCKWVLFWHYNVMFRYTFWIKRTLWILLTFHEPQTSPWSSWGSQRNSQVCEHLHVLQDKQPYTAELLGLETIPRLLLNIFASIIKSFFLFFFF